MKRFNYKKYVLFALLLLCLVSLPAAAAQSFRARIISLVSPIWRGVDKLLGSKKNEYLERIHRLEIENHLLRIEIGKLSAEMEKTYAIESLQKELASEKKRHKEVQHLLSIEASSVPARVIYRDPCSWGCALWINVGEETNRKLGRTLIKKNSPVLYGRAVVGAIDYVSKTQSKVRLITDAALKPSVRAARGRPQAIFLQENVEVLLRHLKVRNDLAPFSKNLIKELEAFSENLSTESDAWYLAKGILEGSKTPMWRSLWRLKGMGFNYDFDDKEGFARDLVLGKTKSQEKEGVPILKVGDLLITTGMDGVFPAGLRVAEVSRVYPLREGAYTYEIEAYPSVGNLDDLTSVFVIAPLGFDNEELASRTP